MTKHMTRTEMADKLLAKFKEQAKASGEDLTDTVLDLSINHTFISEGEDNVEMNFNMVGYESVVIGLLTAYLMRDKDKADQFIEAVNGLGDESIIEGIDVENQNHTFAIKLSVDKDLNPTVVFDNVTTGRLGVAMYILHEEHSSQAVMKVRDILVGLRDKYEEGLIYTGEREPDFKDTLRHVIEVLGKEVSE